MADRDAALPRTAEGSNLNDQTQTFTSVFDALADTPQEAANLRAWAELAEHEH